MTMAEVAVNNLASSILSGTLALLFVFALIKVVHIEDRATRFFLLFAPLLRSFFVLTDAPSASLRGRVVAGLLVRFPDPFGWFNMQFPETRGFLFSSGFYRSMIVLSAITIMATIVSRWIRLFVLRVRLSRGPSLNREAHQDVVEMVDYLSHQMGVRSPRLVMADDERPVPFTIGVRRPAIVLNENLIKSFQGRKLEAILAHEIAHIKRFDSLTRWLAVILKDLQFFNPATNLAHRYLEVERELACDFLAAESIGVSPRYFADVLVDYVEFNRSQPAGRLGQMVPALAFQSELKVTGKNWFDFEPLKRRIDVLRSSSDFPAKPSAYALPWIAAIFLLVVWVQIGLYIKAWGLNMFIR